MGDPLLDAIRAAPDDDAPRLVWADREGGEIGELVVVQCALAAEERPSRDMLRTLYERQRKLLKHLPGTWERGFAVEVPLRFEDLEADPELEAWPLAHTVEFSDAYITNEDGRSEGAHDVVGRIVEALDALPARIVGMSGYPLIEASHERYARSQWYTDDLVRALGASERGRRLRHLDLSAVLEDGALLEPFTNLASLRILLASTQSWAVEPLLEANPGLVDLDLGHLSDGELVAIANAPLRLRHLGIATHRASRGVKQAFVESPALAELRSLSFDFDEDWASVLPHASFASTLRELRCPLTDLTDPMVDVLLALPALECLRISISGSRKNKADVVARLREHIPHLRL